MLKKVLKDEKPITVRPGALLAETDLAAERKEAETKCGRALDDDEFAAYLMYPKVFTEFAAVNAKYGPISALPTPVFFYGMKPGSELTIEIERGKAIVVQLTAVGETRADGQVEVFFELNGQPRHGDLRGVGPPREHRLTEEHAPDRHAVDAAGQLAVHPDLDGMGKPSQV